MIQPQSTERKILEAAVFLVQTRGYNAFSFHDISRAVGIRTASVHHHFPTKSHLGHALLIEQHRALSQALSLIDAQAPNPCRKIERYVGLFTDIMGDGASVALSAVLAGEFNTLPDPMRQELRHLFDEGEIWLARVLGQARTERTLNFDSAPALAARTFSAALQGAMMSARTFADRERLASTGRWLIDLMRVRPPVLTAPTSREQGLATEDDRSPDRIRSTKSTARWCES